MKISILGSGAFGTSISILLSGNGHLVSLWTHRTETYQQLIKTREDKKLGVKIPENVQITNEINCVKNSDIVVIATPSYAVLETLLLIKEKINEKTIIVLLAKGIFKRDDKYFVFSDLAAEILGDKQPIVSLTGPTHAEEIAIKKPSAILSASKDEKASKMVQDAFMSDTFRVYTATDILGAQLGGALKNVIALAAGICEGMGFGDNAAAGLITRGFAEMSRLGEKMGAKKETFTGLSGIGDLIVTCMSAHSRNKKAGKYIGEGLAIEEVFEKVGAVVEGYYATKSAYELSKLYNVEMPITGAVYDVLYNNQKPAEIFSKIMNRSKKAESEETYIF